jgi:hypothetical protein
VHRQKSRQVNAPRRIENLDADDPIILTKVKHYILGDAAVDDILRLIIQPDV